MSHKLICALMFCFSSLTLNADEQLTTQTQEIIKNLTKNYQAITSEVDRNSSTPINQVVNQSKEDYNKALKDSKHQASIKKAHEVASPKLNIKEVLSQSYEAAKASGNTKVADELNHYIKNFASYTKKVPTIFYFYSESMDAVALERFFNKAKRLNKNFEKDGLNLMAVYRGFPLACASEDIYSSERQRCEQKNIEKCPIGYEQEGDICYSPKKFIHFNKRYDKQSISNGKFKIHPLMYRFYKLESVPAYAIADCPRDFAFKECENHLLIRGDISLEEALEYFSKENKKYQIYHDFLTHIR